MSWHLWRRLGFCGPLWPTLTPLVGSWWLYEDREEPGSGETVVPPLVVMWCSLSALSLSLLSLSLSSLSVSVCTSPRLASGTLSQALSVLFSEAGFHWPGAHHFGQASWLASSCLFPGPGTMSSAVLGSFMWALGIKLRSFMLSRQVICCLSFTFFSPF